MKKVPAELQRAMNALNQVEEELRQQIFRLGQICYGQMKDSDSVPEPYVEAVGMMRQLEAKRKDAFKNKLRLEGKVMCENCGAELPVGSVFCSLCGKRLEEQAQPAPAAPRNVCPNCGQAVSGDSKFCVNCGQKLQ